jgi:hypothetical protein
MKKLLIISFLLLACFSKPLLAENRGSYTIISVSSDKTYYNLIQHKGKLYIGTSKGAIVIDAAKNTEIVDDNLKGYLAIEKGEVISNSFHMGHIILKDENIFNYLLPDAYKKLVSIHNRYADKLYIINSGKLFIYRENNYSVSFDSLSVRSITSNYLGSYSGVFKNGVKLAFPLYTDGYIREFGNETFISYEGLYRDSSGVKTVFANSKKEVQIGTNVLGFGIDVQPAGRNNYAVLTTKGLFLVNFSTKKVEPIFIDGNKDVNCSIIKVEDADKNPTRIYYSAENKLYYFIPQTKETVLLIDTKHNKAIKQAYFPNTVDKIYVLFEDKMSLFTLDTKEKRYSEDILIDHLLYCHNFELFKEKLFITSNVGAHIYDLKTNKSYLNVVPIEANNRSLSIVNDTIRFGTINGVVNIGEEDLENLIQNHTAETTAVAPEADNTSKYIIAILIAIICVLSVQFYRLKKAKTVSAAPAVDTITTRENVIHYIHVNISKVTIQSICDNFNISPIQLYEILEDDKPGEVIRKHRISLVRKFRKEKKDENFIAEHTGFSVSYLKKIF